MSSHLSAYQTLFKTCFQFLLALICFLLFLAFMILPERLVSAPITAEVSNYSDSYISAYEISDEAIAEWQFHLQFPFVGSVFETPPAAPVAAPSAAPNMNYLSRLLMMLQHFGKEVGIPAAGIK